MNRTNSFKYASAFKNTLSPCYTQNGKSIRKAGWHAGGKKKRTQRGGNKYPKNPPYGLTTCAHDPGKTCNSAPLNLALYERSFEGPFPARSSVNFNLTQPFEGNKLLVEPTPMNGGAKKKKAVKKTAGKRKSKVVRKKSKVGRKKSKVVRRRSKEGKKRSKVVRRISKVGKKKSKVVRRRSKVGKNKSKVIRRKSTKSKSRRS